MLEKPTISRWQRNDVFAPISSRHKKILQVGYPSLDNQTLGYTMSGVLWVLTLGALVASCWAVDQTRQPGALGASVVESVVSLIRESCLFADDKRFLRRLAYVQSRDGTDPKTYGRSNYHGGIWQVGPNWNMTIPGTSVWCIWLLLFLLKVVQTFVKLAIWNTFSNAWNSGSIFYKS